MAKNPCAYLRRESARERIQKADKDNTNAVIEYMMQRGFFDEWLIDGKLPRDFKIVPGHAEKLPWNDAAPARITEVSLVEHCEGSWHFKSRRKRTWNPPSDEPRLTVKVPHWDYDGIDPLVGREPYERQAAHNWFDQAENNRRAQGVWSGYEVDHYIDECEACEELTVMHAGIPDAATFTYATGPEG